MLLSKIHRATVTVADLHYEGSITIDLRLMDLASLNEYQQVEIYNITTGARFSTYVMKGPADSGVIQINGAAARLASRGDLIIIAAYVHVSHEELQNWRPKKIFVDGANRPR